MIIPSKRLCDLCKNEIPSGTRFSQLTYPLDRADVLLLQPVLEAAGQFDVLPGLRVFTPRPDAFAFEICRGCVDGILPMTARRRRAASRRRHR